MFNDEYKKYMPDVPDEEISRVTYKWLKPLVEKIKTDLIALGRWDRQCVSLSVLSVYSSNQCAETMCHEMSAMPKV